MSTSPLSISVLHAGVMIAKNRSGRSQRDKLNASHRSKPLFTEKLHMIARALRLANADHFSFEFRIAPRNPALVVGTSNHLSEKGSAAASRLHFNTLKSGFPAID